MKFNKSQRSQELDVIKGMLVVVMVFYHCASMAVDKYNFLSNITDRIAFIHYAFVLISGVI